MNMEKETIFERLKQASLKYYSKRDSSHGLGHVEKVAKNVQSICKSEKYSDKLGLRIMLAAAFFHDAYDHKYVKKEHTAEVKENIKNDLNGIGFSPEEIESVLTIIDNISFSVEKKIRQNGGEIKLGENQYLRDIVSDADKLEALGLVAVERMVLYEQHTKSQSPLTQQEKFKAQVKHIQDHCEEKLFILISEKYIRTPSGIKVAEPLLKQLRSIVSDDAQLVEIIKKTLLL